MAIMAVTLVAPIGFAPNKQARPSRSVGNLRRTSGQA